MIDNILNHFIEKSKNILYDSGKEVFFISDWNNDLNEVKLPYKILQNIKPIEYSKYLEYHDTTQQRNKHIEFIQHYCRINNHELDMFITANNTSSIYLILLTLIKKYCLKEFLIFRPNYFSIDEILLSNNCNLYSYDISQAYQVSDIESIILNKKIEVLILTNPIYSLGLEIESDFLKQLIHICELNNIWLVVDNVFDGLSWNNKDNQFINKNTYQKILSSNKTILIDSPSKKLFLNSIKVGLIYSNKKFIKNLDLINDYSHGSFSEIGIQLLMLIYNYENISYIQQIINYNIENAKSNLYLFNNIIDSENSYFLDINNGFYTFLFYRNTKSLDYKISVYNYMDIMMKNNNLFVLPTTEFNYPDDKDFGVRINLLKNNINIEHYILKLSSFNFHSFN